MVDNKNIYNFLRPKNFAEVINCEEVKDLCINSINKNIFPSLMLFHGAYGSGKTTIARIHAKAMNCVAFIETKFKPCGNCNNCLNSDKFIYEFNSSNYTKIDNMREIVEDTIYKPFYGKYKVYILDEIHMLSLSSFNILLKEVEEPYYYIKYICITTNLSKIPETFVSRAVLCSFYMPSICDIKNAISIILEKLNKFDKNLIIDNNIQNKLLNLSKKTLVTSYRQLVNKTIQILINNNTDSNSEEYCNNFIDIITNKNIHLKEKIEKIKFIVSNFSNTQELLDKLFKYFMLYVTEENSIKGLKLAEIVLKEGVLAIQSYNGMIFLISKIHFFLLELE